MLPERRVDLDTKAFVAFERVRRVAAGMLASVAVLSSSSFALAQDKRDEKKKELSWYERIHLRGYTQVRYNRIGATNPQLKNDQGDRSIGDSGGIFIRRARLIFYGEMNRFVSIYLQPDLAGTVGESNHVLQLRDWYSDINLDSRKEFRFRVGQSKVPYGFENMQSSQNRIPLDRNDALNSTVKDERDLGIFFYWASDYIRRKFKELVDQGLKGSGDYGMTGVGFYNGQTANQRDKNDNKHFIARIAYPFDIGSQTFELDVGGYTGRYVPSRGDGISGNKEYRDMRMHGTFVLYPKPFGIFAEYTWGVGPELVGKRIEERPLEGGYVTFTYRHDAHDFGVFMPYTRLQRYDGGKKWEQNANRHEVREIEAGLEWQFRKFLEITAAYMGSERTVNGVEQTGKLMRLQLQFNY